MRPAGTSSPRPWSATGAARPAAPAAAPTVRPAGGGRGTGGPGRGGSGGGGRGGSGGGGGSRGSGGGAGGTGPGRRRLIDYPRAGRTGVRRWLPSWKLLSGLFLTLVALVVGAGVVAYAMVEIPEPDDFAQAQTTTVYYADGTTVMGSFGIQDRVIVTGDEIPEHVRAAVVAAEDRTFYENAGISPTGLARALWTNLRGGDRQGGSTITQQYAERYYFGETVTSYTGKAKEALLAIKLDQAQDKDEILENYLNTIYLGRGAYGVETAAQKYFGVSAAELTVSQAALIAGIIPSPSNWDPAENPEKAQERWEYVLDGMVTTGALTQDERDAQVFPETVPPREDDRLAGPGGYLMAMVKKEILEKSPITEEELETRGYRIITTVDRGMQISIETVAAGLPADRAPNLRIGAVTLDPADGGIKALYGGPDYVTVGQNAVTQSIAQAGSTFKPLTLVGYLEEGGSLRSRYDGDSGLKIGDYADTERGLPNFGGQDFGEIDVVRATAQSVNTVYAQMNEEITPEKTIDVARRAGVPESVAIDPVTSNVLGTASPNPIHMATVFNTLAAQGTRHEPFIVRTVEYLDGGTAYQGGEEGAPVFEPDVMADTTYALTQVVERGSGERADIGRPLAGKTGTSNDNKSAWFIGYTPQLTTAVVLFQPSADGTVAEEITPFGDFAQSQITGGSYPAILFQQHMSTIHEGLEVVDFPERADVGEPNKPPLIAVPSVVGLSEAEASSTLQAAGFRVDVARGTSPDVPEGTVISQSPSGEAERGSTVTITVSEGTGEVDVPDVVGLTQQAARSALEGAGFGVGVSEQASDEPAGTVLSQDPSGQAAEGSTVTIVVSSGPEEEEPEPEPEPTPTEPPPGEDEGDGGGDAGGGNGGGNGGNLIPAPPGLQP
ncbi:hypothetical protein GCM10010972_12280 [Cellulomonas carbonis]|nr:hypothetical protein GCM10010972_12280 [Cellulomonas carbonis]